MIELLIPQEYLPYLENLPDAHKVANFAITFAPLYTYGTTCLGIYRLKSLLGFSIDICATMMMALMLRILYYTLQPFEISLLRQSFIMLAIQCVLLRVLLRFRPTSYNPDHLAPLPDLASEFAAVPTLLSSYYQYDSPRFLLFLADVAWLYVRIWGGQLLRLFDVYYRRPLLFWQWVEEFRYWLFLAAFGVVFSALTLLFESSLVYSSIVGTTGLFIEALLPLPQVLLLLRLQSVKNFKVIMLVLWLGGDCTKLGYLLAGTKDVLMIFIVAAVFQMSLDFVVLGQYLHYRRLDRAKPELPVYEMSERSPR